MLRGKIKSIIKSLSGNKFSTLNIIEISKSSIINNFDIIQNNNPNFSIIPVLKANAYGHGIIQVAKILNSVNCDFLAVDGYFEAAKINNISKHKILVLGYIKPVNFNLLNTKKCSFVIQDIEGLKSLGLYKKPVNIHIELNTGMNRMGLQVDEINEYLNEVKKYSNINIEGIMTHLADADNDRDNSYTLGQVKVFDNLVDKILGLGFNPKYIHIAQTAGSVKVVSRHANSLRLGIGLYGISPLSKKDKHSKCLNGLKPALKFTSTIVKVIALKKGDRVSYNGIFDAPRKMNIAVLPLGYYEGIPSSLSNIRSVSFNNKFLPIVGRICMNHTMINIEGIDLKFGDVVTVISDRPDDLNSINCLAINHDLFRYSLMTGFSESTRRIIVD